MPCGSSHWILINLDCVDKKGYFFTVNLGYFLLCLKYKNWHFQMFRLWPHCDVGHLKSFSVYFINFLMLLSSLVLLVCVRCWTAWWKIMWIFSLFTLFVCRFWCMTFLQWCLCFRISFCLSPTLGITCWMHHNHMLLCLRWNALSTSMMILPRIYTATTGFLTESIRYGTFSLRIYGNNSGVECLFDFHFFAICYSFTCMLSL